jgi:glucosamine--fructose-6-phosphate aminotransferase (isomerizing)
VVPVISSGTQIDHLVLFEIGFRKGLALHKKVDALGGKYHHIRNLVEEMNLHWEDAYLDRIGIEDLFGMSAEKLSERIVSGIRQ